MTWRVGTKIPINVYDGDRPVCQCHTASDAKLIVAAVNILTRPDRDCAPNDLGLDTPFPEKPGSRTP